MPGVPPVSYFSVARWHCAKCRAKELTRLLGYYWRSGKLIGSIHTQHIHASHMWILNGHTEVAAYLVSRGADCVIFDSMRLTPFHLAASKGHAKLVEDMVVTGGASIYEKNGNGDCITHSCIPPL